MNSYRNVLVYQEHLSDYLHRHETVQNLLVSLTQQLQSTVNTR